MRACVRACRVWSGVAVVLPSDKKRIFLDLGMLVTEASRSFVHSVPPFPSLSPSFRCAFVARVTSCQHQSGETELGKIKRPRRGKVTSGGGSQSSAPDERTNGVDKAPPPPPKRGTHPGPFLASHAVRQHPPPSTVSKQAGTRPTPTPAAQHTAQRQPSAVSVPVRLCVLSPHLTHSAVAFIRNKKQQQQQQQPGKQRVCVPDAAPI